MPDFPTYSDREERSGRLRLSLGIAGLSALLIPGVRRGAARILLQGTERIGARWGPATGPARIAGLATELRQMERSGIPNAARQALGLRRSVDVLEEALGRGIDGGARARAEQIVRTRVFRGHLGGRHPAAELLADEKIATILEEQIQAASHASPGVVLEEIRRRETARLLTAFQRARFAAPTINEVRQLGTVEQATRLFRQAAEELLSSEAKRAQTGLGARVLNFFGVRRATAESLVGTPLADQIQESLGLLREFANEAIVRKIPIGGVYHIGDRTVDLRRFQNLTTATYEWLRENFQVPLGPGFGGIPPFQLFPWMRGRLPSHVTHIGGASRDPVLRSVLGIGDDDLGLEIIRVGRRFIGIDLDRPGAGGAARFLDIDAEVRSGVWGYMRRRTQAILSAQEARAVGRAPGFRGWFGGGLDPEEGIGTLISRFTKFRADSDWAPRLFRRILNEPVSIRELRQAGHYLTHQRFDRRLEQALIRRGRGLFPEGLEGLLSRLNEDEAVLQFFERAAADPDFRAGTRLHFLLGSFRNSPMSVLTRIERGRDREVFGFNLIGRERDLRGIDLMRRAILDEIEERIVRQVGETGFVRWIRSLRLPAAEEEAALAYGYGKTLLRRLDEEGMEQAVSWLRSQVGVQETIEGFVRRRSSPYAPWGHSEDPGVGVATVIAQRSVSPRELITAFNQARKSGADFFESIRAVLNSRFIRQFTAFFTGNQRDVTTLTLGLEYFPRRLEALLRSAGLGLPDQDLLSGGSIVANLFLKRIFPATLAVELYRYADYQGERLFGAGLSDAYANIRAHMGQFRARWFGERIPFLGRRELFPGLETIIPNRSLEEEREHQVRGYEPVRRGRFWLTGSRTPFWGEKIDYFIPSAVRAARSNWQGAENADLNTRDYWAHSFLPLPENRFLGPLRAILFPHTNYWWEEKHARDRPYIQSGDLFDPHTVHGPLLNATIGRILKPRRIYHPEYLPTSLGGTASQEDLRRINQILKSGEDLSGISSIVGAGGGAGGDDREVQILSPGVLGRGDGQEIGSLAEITPGGRLRIVGLPSDLTRAEFHRIGYRTKRYGAKLSRQEIEEINRATRAGVGGLTPIRSITALRASLQTTPFREEDLDLIDFHSGIIAGVANIQDVTGLYGWMTKRVHEPKHKYPVVDTPQRAYGFARRFWDLHIGGIGGDVSEFGRRFLNRPERLNVWNPIPNRMPSWLPGGEYFIDFRHGDPFCLSADTLVETDQGYKKAAEVEPGDLILTHKGRRLPVRRVIIRTMRAGEKAYRFTVAGLDKSLTLEFSEEHPILVKRLARCSFASSAICRPPVRNYNGFCDGKNCKNSWAETPLEFVEAQDIQIGDAVVYPIPKVEVPLRELTYVYDWHHAPCLPATPTSSTIALTPELGWLIGLYCAEGSTGKQAGRPVQLRFSLSADEVDVAERVADLLDQLFHKRPKLVVRDQSLEVVLCCARTAQIFDAIIPGNLYQKRLPRGLFHADADVRWAALLGYMLGDASVQRNELISSSANRELALDFHRLAFSLGVPARYQKHPTRPCHHVILHTFHLLGRDLSWLLYKAELVPVHFNRQPHVLSWSDGEYIYSLVMDKEEIELPYVYGFEVDEDDTFCVIAFATHNTKIPRGEMRLPGEAYERLNPDLKLMQLHVSHLGKTVPEMMHQMLYLKTSDVNYDEAAVELENRVRRAIQSTWKRMGVLAAARAEVYNPRLGIIGHLDAVINTPRGLQVAAIEMLEESKYREIARLPLPEHLSQLNFYLHETGIRSGQIIYINQDDPSRIRIHQVRFDPREFNRTVARLQEARANLLRMVESGLISRGDLYDPVTRFEILADVAPYSDQYAHLREYLTEENKAGRLSVRENARFQAAKKRTAAQKKRLNITPYRFRDANLREEWVTVRDILDPNTFTIRESEHPIRLAGVRSSQERIAHILGRDPRDSQTLAERQFARFGIRPGARVRVLLEGDPQRRIADDVLQTQRAVVFGRGGNVNRQLLEMGIAVEKEGDYSDTGVAARFTPWEQFIGRLWEAFAHLDTPIHTKLLKVRTPLEELKRGIVYGKTTGSWNNPISDYVIPTIESYAARNPILGGLSLGIFASFFFSTSIGKRYALLGGAAVGAGLSALRWIQEGITGEAWKPTRTRRREELEEYWDVLKYLKFQALAAHEADLARRLEGIDVDKVERDLLLEGERRKRQENWLKEQKRRLKRGEYDFRSEIDDLNRRYLELIRERKIENRERIRYIGEEIGRLRRIAGRGPESEVARREQIRRIQSQLNQLEGPQGRIKLGPHATRAVQFRELAQSTLYGIEPGETPFINLFRAFPKYKRELIQGFIDKSSEREREEIFRLLPRHEQRVMGHYLGIDKKKIPTRPRLEEFFKKHPLPGPDWIGWSPTVDLEQLRLLALKGEGLDPFESGIYPIQIEEAERDYGTVPIPTMRGTSPDIQSRLNEILSGQGLSNVQVQVQTSPHDGDSDEIDVILDVRQKREQEIIDALQLGR